MAGKKPAKNASGNVAQKVWSFAQPEVEALGLILWDVVFEKVGTLYELILYIDRNDGSVSVEDCEKVSRVVDPLLDRYDPIEVPYTFSVSSSGQPRTLRLPAHFAAFMGSPVEVKLYPGQEGPRVWQGVLAAYEDGAVTIVTAEEEEKRWESAQIAQVKTIYIEEEVLRPDEEDDEEPLDGSVE